MDLSKKIMRRLEAAGRPLDDDELAELVGVRRQAINQAARRLAERAKTIRASGPGGKLVNYPNTRKGRKQATAMQAAEEERRAEPGTGDLLTEDEVKQAVKDYLEADRWKVHVAWGRERGVDIEATKRKKRFLLEAKGEAKLQPQQVNYFLGALGELIQRMDDPKAEYGLALPDNKQYRGLVERLPAYGRQRLRLRVLWVSRGKRGLMVEEGKLG